MSQSSSRSSHPRRVGPDPVTALLASVLEAWSELRVHRGRVLLSLVGVGVAVAALTLAMGVGGAVQSVTEQQQVQGGGRPATFAISTPSSPKGESGDSALFDRVMQQFVARHEVRYHARTLYAELPVRLADGAHQVDTHVVDPDYATIHELTVSRGRWLRAGDAQRMAPALVIDSNFWRTLGSPDPRTHPVVTLAGQRPATAVVVGVYPAASSDPQSPLQMYMLPPAWQSVATDRQRAATASTWELWVPPSLARGLMDRAQNEVSAAFGKGWSTSAYRTDYLASGQDPLLPLRLGLLGVAGVILLLGALGLLNITLVTVRHRIREIGIRRSFGATAGRVFVGVMMESVVATVAAGAVGVVMAVLVLRNPWLPGLLHLPENTVFGFPIDAALAGLAASAAVGALAGLVPALVAVRVRVIDAIRY